MTIHSKLNCDRAWVIEYPFYAKKLQKKDSSVQLVESAEIKELHDSEIECSFWTWIFQSFRRLWAVLTSAFCKYF